PCDDVDDRRAVVRARAAVHRIRSDVRFAPRVLGGGAVRVSRRAGPGARRLDAFGRRVLRAADDATVPAVESILRGVDAEALAARSSGRAPLSGVEVAPLDAVTGGTARVGTGAISERAARHALMALQVAVRRSGAD